VSNQGWRRAAYIEGGICRNKPDGLGKIGDGPVVLVLFCVSGLLVCPGGFLARIGYLFGAVRLCLDRDRSYLIKEAVESYSCFS
jgi:hypothetical protein